MNVLILGGAGFLGNNLARRCLRESGVRVAVVDSLDPRFASRREDLADLELEFVTGDIRDAALLERMIPGKDVIFNCAGQTSHPLSLEDPVLDARINCIGTLEVLCAVRRFNPHARVVYTSSSTVVGKGERTIDESHPECPLDIYSANKGVAEKYHYIFANSFDLQTVVLRFTNLFGPFGKGDSQFGFINYFIHLASEGRPLTIYGSGEQTRNVMCVADAVDILWIAATHPALVGRILLAAGSEHHSVRAIAEAIAATFDGSVESIPWPDYRRRIEIDHVRFDASRLRELTGWQPRYSLQSGLQLTREWMLERSC